LTPIILGHYTTSAFTLVAGSCPGRGIREKDELQLIYF